MIEDPQKRLLKDQMVCEDNSASSDERQEAAWRILFWHVRFQAVRHQEEVGDTFMAFWVNMNLEGVTRSGRSARKKIEKDINKFLNRPDLLAAMAEVGDQADRLLFDELQDAIFRYFSTCQTDRQYTTYLFNLKKLTDDQVSAKTASQTVDNMILPLLDIDSPWQAVLIRAVATAFGQAFVNQDDLLSQKLSQSDPDALNRYLEILKA